jgi:hypothetical protein
MFIHLVTLLGVLDQAKGHTQYRTIYTITIRIQVPYFITGLEDKNRRSDQIVRQEQVPAGLVRPDRNDDVPVRLDGSDVPVRLDHMDVPVRSEGLARMDVPVRSECLARMDVPVRSEGLARMDVPVRSEGLARMDVPVRSDEVARSPLNQSIGSARSVPHLEESDQQSFLSPNSGGTTKV